MWSILPSESINKILLCLFVVCIVPIYWWWLLRGATVFLSFFLQHWKTCPRPLDSKKIHQFYRSLNIEGFICYPFASSVFTKDVGCCLLPVYLFWNDHTTRNIMDQDCTLYSIKTTHVPNLEYFMAGSWGVDIALKKTGRVYSCICHVTADKCLCFPLLAEIGGKCISISIAVCQVSGSVLIFSRGDTVSGNAAVLGITT